MNRVSQEQKRALKSDFRRSLKRGADPQKLDEFLGLLFQLVERFGGATCTLASKDTLRIQARDKVLEEVIVPLAKPKLRAACARLAVRCSEWAGRQLSLYGDEIEVQLPSTKQRCRVHFENTTASQKIDIEANGVATKDNVSFGD